MKPIFVNPEGFPRWGKRPRTDEELQILRQSVLSGAYVVHPQDIADAMLVDAWLDEIRPAENGD